MNAGTTDATFLRIAMLAAVLALLPAPDVIALHSLMQCRHLCLRMTRRGRIIVPPVPCVPLAIRLERAGWTRSKIARFLKCKEQTVDYYIVKRQRRDCERLANSPSNSAPNETPLASLISAHADSSAEFGTVAAPFVVKLDPGNVWNAGRG